MEENSKEGGAALLPPHDPLPPPGSLGPGPQRALGRGLQTPIPEPEMGREGATSQPGGSGSQQEQARGLSHSGCPWSPYPLSGSHQSLLEGRHMLGQVGEAPPPVFPRPLPSGRAVRKTVGPPGSRWLGPLGGGAGSHGHARSAPRWGRGGSSSRPFKSWDRVLRPHLGSCPGASQGPEPPRHTDKGLLPSPPNQQRSEPSDKQPGPGGPPSRPLLSPGPLWSQQPHQPMPAPGLGLQPEQGALVRGLLQPGPAWTGLDRPGPAWAAASCPADTPSPTAGWWEERGPRPGAGGPRERALASMGHGGQWTGPPSSSVFCSIGSESFQTIYRKDPN